MGELLDRQFQRELLERLQSVYPLSADLKRSFGQEVDHRLLVNLAYLDEHGLVDLKWTIYNSGEPDYHNAKITAKGMDFIADDGGLSAILGVVIVKLHDDTIRSLLIERVTESTEDETVKARMIEQIKNLPAEALKNVTMDILKAGLASAPAAYAALQAYLSS